jgi:phosphatidylserine decarboxylase
MKIHKEGINLLFFLLVTLVVINLGIIYMWPEAEIAQNIVMIVSIIFYILNLQFFRNPTITVPTNPKHVLAPADGEVVVIEETSEDEYFKDNRLQISIFMSPLNVHVNRSPVAGIVKYFKYHPGIYLMAWNPKASAENERTTTVVTTASGVDILFRQVAGFLARRIKWYIDKDVKLNQGQEYGFIKFGSRVDVFLPLDAKISVEKGTKTKGGRTVIAEIA